MSDCLQPHGLQHARLPGPSPTPGVCSNSCPSSQWCYLIISFSESISLYLWVFSRYCCSFTKSCLTLQDAVDWSMLGSSVLHYLAEFVRFMSVESVILSDLTLCCFFSFCLQSFLTSGSFPVSKLFTGQIIGASASVLPMNILGWFHLGLICLTFFSPKDFQESSPVRHFESINSLAFSLLSGPTLMSIHDYWKNRNFDYMDLCRQSDVCLLFSMLSRFVIAFLPKSKCLLI